MLIQPSLDQETQLVERAGRTLRRMVFSMVRADAAGKTRCGEESRVAMQKVA